MNRFELVSIPLEDEETLIDNVTGKKVKLPYQVSQDVCRMLNEESDRADRIAEANTTRELLKLKWERDIYKRFSDEVLNVFKKHNIESIAKLDQMMFNQKKW